MRFLTLILLFTLLVISQINTILDVDLWLNLKTGEYIVEHFRIPHVDIFSFTLNNQQWIYHGWISQVIFYLIFKNFGWLGLNILKALIISTCFFILIKIPSGTKKIFYSVFFIILSVLAFGYRSFVRPEIFSYLLLSIFFYILERKKNVYILPLIQIIWVNIHGYFILGPLLVFLYGVEEFLSGNRANTKKIISVLMLTVLGCFINPYGYKGVWYPIKIIEEALNSQRLYLSGVYELMMPMGLGFERCVFFWLLAILASITFFINLKHVKVRHILIFALSFIASYISLRNMPIFILMSMPLASMNLNQAVFTKGIKEERFFPCLAIIICGIIYLFLSNRYYILVNQYGMRKTESNFQELVIPRYACDFLEKNSIKGRIFNTLDFGPYIAYRFYPEKRVFIDTRIDFYKEDFFDLYRRSQHYPKEWIMLQKRYDFSVALIRHLFGGTERILRYLYRAGDWEIIYYDTNSAVFLKDTPYNKPAIDKFRIDFETKHLRDSDIDIHIARFFEKIGEVKLAEKIYEALLEINPQYLEAGIGLSQIYINVRRYNDGIGLIDRLLRHYPESAELYANKAAAYMMMDRKKDAMAVLKKSVALNPYLKQACYMLGLLYLDMKDVEAAFSQFIKYTKIDPYNPEVHNILGDLYGRKALLKKSMLEYNEANALEGR